MPRQDCVEGGRAAIGRMLIQLVVQCLVDDASAPQAFQLVTEMLDACRRLFLAGIPTVTLGMDGYDNLGTTWTGRPVRLHASGLRRAL